MSRIVVAGLVFFEVNVGGDDFAVEPGRERFVRSMTLGFGGAINTASVLRALGQDVTLAFPAGMGIADHAIHRATEALDIDAHTWPAPDDPAISLVLAFPEDRAFVTAAHFASLAECPALPAAQHIHVPGLEEARALEPLLTKARSAGATISVSGSWAPNRLASLAADTPPWDLLFLNEAEARSAAGSVDGALSDLTNVRDLIVTLDDRGAVGRVEDVRFAVPAHEVAVADHTGAGDAFAAGFVTGRLAGRSGEGAGRLATEVAARQLMVTGGVARRADVFADLLEQS